jgi:hypothetical protein
MSLNLNLITKTNSKMKEIKKMDFKNFEALSESGHGNMIGGFSAIIIATSTSSFYATNSECHVVNNCNGGNCTAGCGASGGIGTGG